MGEERDFMNAHEREAIRQAKLLRPRHPECGLEADILKLPCQFKEKYRCQKRAEHLEYDPTGEFKLPAPSCNNCHTYLDNCFKKDIKSEEAHYRLAFAIARTYESLMEWDK